MLYRSLADALVVIHLGFVVFALFGGFLVLKCQKVIWGHIPAMLWAIGIEFSGWVCPLTPLENWLRQQAGESGYQVGFIEHYLMPILYPPGLSRELQVLLGTIVLLLNLAIYSWIWHRRKQREM